MAKLQRHLKIFGAFILGLVLGVPPVSAQAGGSPNEPAPPQFRVVAVGNTTPLTKILYEYKGKSVMIYPSDVSLSPVYERQKAGPILLYREVPATPPETKVTRVPILTANSGSAPLCLLVLAASANNTVTCTAIDDSWTAFPAQTVRILNFSHRKVAVQVEGAVAEIAPKASHLFPYSANKPRIRCKVASKEDDGWKLQFENSQAIIPGARVNILISDCEPSPMDPAPEGINVLKMIDPLLPPKTEN